MLLLKWADKESFSRFQFSRKIGRIIRLVLKQKIFQGKDQGINVRQRSKELVALVTNDDELRNEFLISRFLQILEIPWGGTTCYRYPRKVGEIQ